MPLFYPPGRAGRFSLSMGLTFSLLHQRYGLDAGERFHRDILFRVASTMEIDRLVWQDFRELGLGFEEPFPRASIEPFGHRFVPVLYGSDCVYSPANEPAARHRQLDPAELSSLPGWSEERFEATEAVRLVASQARALRARYGEPTEQVRRMGYNPHYSPLSSLQNLGSVINTAVSVFGESVLLLYQDDPELLRAFYRNVTDCMLRSLEWFPRLDGRRLEHLFVGDCTVAMISPAQYETCNLSFDQELVRYAQQIGAEFLLHQDSDVTPHLPAYARLGPVHALDVGQDTDFSEAARRFPGAAVNCILFPSWIASTSAADMEAELVRLMRAGLAFRRFSFSIFEVDPVLADGTIQAFHESFGRCAETVSREGAS